MGLFTITEDRPTPRAVYNWRIVACAIIGSFASCAIGYDSAFIGTTLALPSFKEAFNFASYSPDGLAGLNADIVSVYQAGAFFGSLTAYISTHYLGRRTSLFIYVVIFLLGAGLNCGAKGASDLGLIIGGRVLTGWGVGGCSSIVPIYLSELAPPAVRGRLVGSWEIGWQIGGLVGFWINYGVEQTMPASHEQWLIPFAVQLIPISLLFFGTFLVPESPRWLLARGRREKALKSLTWLRNLPETDTYIIEEVSDIDAEIERNPGSFWKPFQALRHRHMQWRFTLSGLLFMFQNGSGINAINYYSPTVLKSIGVQGASSELLATGIFGVVKTVAVFVWIAFVVDRFHRRTLLIWGAGGSSICMWILGAYTKVADPSAHPSSHPNPGGTAAIFFFFLWIVPYSQTWSGLPWVISSEMFPLDVRGLGQASAAANNWFWNFIISRFTPQMILTMGYGIYFFFASIMILSMFFVFFCLPETSNIPLESVDRLFLVRPIRSANKIVMEEVRREHESLRQHLETGDVLKENVQVEQKENAA